MMSVSDLSSEQSAPDLHNLMYHLLICVILWLDVQVTMCVGVHSLPEVLHRDTKPSCCLNTSDLTRMGVPTRPFHGGHSKDQVLLLPSPPGLSQASDSAEGEPRAEPDNCTCGTITAIITEAE